MQEMGESPILFQERPEERTHLQEKSEAFQEVV